MRFWQKIFFGALIIFIIVYNIMGTVLLRTSHISEVNREIERGLSEQYSMGTALSANIKYAAYKLGGMNNASQDILAKTIQDYSIYYGLNNIYIQVYDQQNTQIFNNFTEQLPTKREELDNIPSDRRQYIIRDVGTATYLFISGHIQVEGTDFVFVYIRNISAVYSSYNQQIKLFVWLNIGASIITAFAMLLFSLWMTRSIKRLNQSTLIISNGNYSERVKITTKDEMGELSKNFNKMADIIEEKISELERTANEREQFINHLTHELKTPLTSIIGYANLLRTTDCTVEQHDKALEYLYESSKRLENLSFKLMDLIYLNRSIKEFKLCDMDDIIQSTIIAVLNSLELRHITLQADFDEGKLLCDKDLIVTMLVNLIDNAAKASQDGQIIKLGAASYEDCWLFSVTDYGRGIEKEEIGKITQPFYTADKNGNCGYKSIGLGLTLCNLIAELHGAALRFDSVKGEGTTVSIKICYN
jgi:signal transduction histidine kinase